jgi:hypothetical protein
MSNLEKVVKASTSELVTRTNTRIQMEVQRQQLK